MASRVQKPLLFCETNSTPQRPIEPHEICVKKITASMMIAYDEFLYYNYLTIDNERRSLHAITS